MSDGVVFMETPDSRGADAAPAWSRQLPCPGLLRKAPCSETRLPLDHVRRRAVETLDLPHILHHTHDTTRPPRLRNRQHLPCCAPTVSLSRPVEPREG